MEDSLKNIEEFLSTTEYSEHLRNGLEDQTTNRAVQGIAAVIYDMRNKSIRDVVVASLKIVAIMANAALPGFGPLAGGILSVCSAILGIIWKNHHNTDSIMHDIKEEEQKAKELKSKVEGLLATFHDSESYLSTLESKLKNIKKRDIDYMMSLIDLYQGSEILGYLRSTIEQGKDLQNNGELKRIICLTNLYVRIAAIRSSMLWRMYSILTSCTKKWLSVWRMNDPEVSNTSDAIRNIIRKADERHKKFLLLLIEPDYNTINLLTLFNPSEQIEIASFVRSYGLEFQRLSDVLQGEFSIKSKRSKDYGIIMSSNVFGHVWGSHTPTENQNLFRFEAVSTEDSIFTIFSIKWPSWYVRMGGSRKCRGYNVSSKGIGLQSQWKILRLKDGYFIMSPIQWPCRYAHISQSWFSFLTGFEGKPSENGHLIFEPKG
ncbi:unnamed protein product [Mytilus coruscus]|uniref:Uncharacterized protein n=1 Tax=Mytilus coruscus TaxID=42192 RepID=A0A6J8EIH1_MYTCO|nr:unnamed protein product [Mytilus coruscus]